MFERLFTVKYITSKSSFCCISSNNFKSLQKNSIKLTYNDGIPVFFSIDANAAIQSDEFIGINSLQAKELGIAENSIVTVTEISKPPTIQSVSICAISKDDHNILEMLAETVQSTLLEQIRVLNIGQKFIIWIGNSMHVSVNVCDMKPTAPGCIDNLTEVVIIPPDQQKNIRQNISEISSGSSDILNQYYSKTDDEYTLRAVPFPNFQFEINANLKFCFNVFVFKNRLNSQVNTLFTPQIFAIRPVDSTSEVYVRLYALEDLQVDTCPFFNSENVFISNVLLEHFNIDIGTRLTLTKYEKELPLAKEIQIFAKQNYSTKLAESFRQFLIETTKGQDLIVLNKETMFCFGRQNARILLKFQPVETAFCRVDSDIATKAKITFTKDNIDVKEYQFKRKDLDLLRICMDIGNLQQIFDESVFLVKEKFQNKDLKFNNVLINGKLGSGKTVLLDVIDDALRKYPNFIHTKRINCKSIKGKTMESLHKIFLSVLGDLIHHQPSVLIMDDLHVLCEHVNDGDALAQNALYFNRISEMLENLFLCYCEHNAIAVLATSLSTNKLNKYIYSTRGSHLFKNVFTIQDLAKDDRKKALQFLLQNYELKDISPNELSEKTESFFMQDLMDFCDKALFESYQDDTNQSILELNSTHFASALNSITISSLDGIKLHSPGVKDFTDIGGLENVKTLIEEVLLWPSKYPNLFEKSPLRLPSGLLLYGSPGTGKTILAGAAARHCGLRLISIKGPELLSKYIGASEQAVRDVFQRAQSAKPCVLFFDEFDSLAPRRGHDNTGVTDRVVNQLLTQLDGVESLSGVFVLAATSRPDLLDPALLRPGRLDRHVRCPLPDKDAREEILKALSKSLAFDSDVNLGKIAEMCQGFSGADLQAVLYSAQLDSVRGLLENDDNDDNGVDDEVVIKRKDDEQDCFTKINQEQLLEAVQKTKPSLSSTEKAKYQLIYRRFEEGNEEFVPGSRATLA